VQLSQEEMGQRQLGIERNCFLRIFLGDWVKFLPQSMRAVTGSWRASQEGLQTCGRNALRACG